MEKKYKKFFSYLLIISKLFVFIAFIYAAWAMYKLGNVVLAGIIILALSLYMIFNKLESMSRGV